jgi:hypothetical protein
MHVTVAVAVEAPAAHVTPRTASVAQTETKYSDRLVNIYPLREVHRPANCRRGEALYGIASPVAP